MLNLKTIYSAIKLFGINLFGKKYKIQIRNFRQKNIWRVSEPKLMKKIQGQSHSLAERSQNIIAGKIGPKNQILSSQNRNCVIMNEIIDYLLPSCYQRSGKF